MGKPGRPFIVTVSIVGFFAPEGGKRAKKRMDDVVTFDEANVFWRTEQPIELTLGDPRIPFGLWRAIENMRREEQARVMLKPGAGYNKADFNVK